jgi:hypothetical protein
VRLIAVAGAGLLVLGVFSTTGCTMSPTTGSGYPYPFDTAILDESRASVDAPDEFRDRTPLPPCDDVTLEQGQQIPDAAVACIEDAGPEGAELATVGPTTEGDPIVTFYRVGPGIDGMEIFLDWTRDTFGGGWHRADCPEASIPVPEDCEYREL